MTVIEEFFSVLSAMAPTFEHSVKDISFIKTPSNFHSTILELIHSSNETLIISSLYIGCSDNNGDDLSKEIISALRKKLSTTNNNNFVLKILVEGTRSSREGDNSIIVLDSLKKDFSHLKVIIHPIFLTKKSIPDRLSPIFLRLPGIFEATSNLLHMKYIVSDDVILMTGANLSEEYFTTRKDRYVLIRNAKALASFYSDLTSLVIESTNFNSCKLDKCGTKNSILELLQLKLPCNRFLEYKKDKVYLFPSLQIPYLGIRHEEAVITTILGMARNLDLPIHLSTAYFNMAPTIQRFFTEKNFSSKENSSSISILTSEPMSNSFFAAPWPKNLIPQIYENLLQRFAAKASASSIKIFQYQRPGWTFHAKGLFISENDSVFLTQLGSSNYGLFIPTF